MGKRKHLLALSGYNDKLMYSIKPSDLAILALT